MTNQLTMSEKARLAWVDVPDWVAELASLVDRGGLNAAGKRIGYSAAVVSQVINRRYAGDLARVEEKVRGALMGLVVDCPVMGELDRSACLDWQAKCYAATSSIRVRMHRACRSGCRNSKIKGGHDAER